MSHCCLCGLLCSLDHAATATCPRRNQWLQPTGTLTAQQSGTAGSEVSLASAQSPRVTQLATQIETIAAHFHSSRRSLIWIDGADVHTLRCAVDLAAAVRGTIHVGHSTGADVSHRVLVSQGWMGSSLAEVASHADLIISLGSDLHTEAPLLAERFISPALASGRAQWCHIDSHASTSQENSQPSPNWTAVWPRSEWYQNLTHLMLGLQNQKMSAQSAAGRMSASTHALLDKLQHSKNPVWIWDVDEFRDDIDELCIHRLLGISRLLSQTARCGLLALDAQVGRVTASETLLWLTGCSGTAQFDGQHWHQPRALNEMSLQDWPTAFDSIVVVRSLSSVYPLPNLAASHFVVTQQSLLPDHVPDDKVTHVGSVGIDSAGHVMRGDRATMLFCQTGEAGSQTTPMSSQLPTAAELLEQVRRRIQTGGDFDAN